MYYSEIDLSQDITSAHMWASVATAAGDAEAKKLQMKIQGLMGFNQIKDGWELARVCVASKFIDCN